MHYDSIPNGVPFVLIAFYADETIMSHSGSQSVYVVRMRNGNVRGRSEAWNSILTSATAGQCTSSRSETGAVFFVA